MMKIMLYFCYLETLRTMPTNLPLISEALSIPSSYPIDTKDSPLGYSGDHIMEVNQIIYKMNDNIILIFYLVLTC